MSILLSLLLSQARVLPEIDRRALELQARAEALQPRAAKQPSAATQQRPSHASSTRISRPAVRTAAATPPRAAQRLPSLRRASGGALDLSAITTICRAAGNQADPAVFLATLSRAYSLNAVESGSLRTSCAAYLAGRADARSGDYGVPAH